MYSKEENQRIKQEFWVDFNEKYPHKWMLYDTKIKDVALKFFVDNKKAQVQLSIEHRDANRRKAYYEQLWALRSILLEDYLPEAIFEPEYYLDNGKCISLIWTELTGYSVSRRQDWDAIHQYFAHDMMRLEVFFQEHQEFIMEGEKYIE